MVSKDWFPDLTKDFEESVRIDREGDTKRRLDAIESYHVTEDAFGFLRDFINRTLGDTEDMRTGYNYWLYGYYGSGKSHLLTVLEGMMDTGWLSQEDKDEVWSKLQSESIDEQHKDMDTLHDSWIGVHDEHYIIPISVNLLKYQGQKEHSFSEIILRQAHQSSELTGVNDDISQGLSPQIDIAYFEDWYRSTDAWGDRHKRATSILEEVRSDSSSYEIDSDTLWQDIQKYDALAEVVLPRLFEEQTGTRDGYSDLRPSDIDPEETVQRLEKLRSEREEKLGKPVKLVLLLDEVSLFIGTDFERLTELQTLAENVDEIGGGNIHLVATAQSKIEDVRPKFAARGADYSILKDRFPHRYQLPSKHVGSIAKARLLSKTKEARKEIESQLSNASVEPQNSLVYQDINQNIKPSLEHIDYEELLDFYPFLPYHPGIFLNVLFNLRKEAVDPAKSIFSGSARAILALMHGLLEEWVETSDADEIVSLEDFYDQIKPELQEILDDDIRVIEGNGNHQKATEGSTAQSIAEDEDLGEFDLRVAKAVLLLRHLDDFIPMSKNNLAVSVMSDLNGDSRTSTKNRVEESLRDMQKYIRPTDNDSGPLYRFATLEERFIYEDDDENKENPDWQRVLTELDSDIWMDIVRDLSLPKTAKYKDSDEEYPVSYSFTLDGIRFESSLEEEGGLEVNIEVHGLDPGAEETSVTDNLKWEVGEEGLDEVRDKVINWWALKDAIQSQTPPSAVESDLQSREDTARRKVVSALENGSFTVRDHKDFRSLDKAVSKAIEVRYPDDFHPTMLQVGEERLDELAQLGSGDALPVWAKRIKVPSSEELLESSQKTIQNNVMSLSAQQLEDADKGLNISTVIDGIVEEKSYYEEARGALRAILWGFCRTGSMIAVNEDGETLEDEAVLREDEGETRLKLLEVENLDSLLEEQGFKETTDTVAQGIRELQSLNEKMELRLSNIQEDIDLMLEDDIDSDAVTSLLKTLSQELEQREEATLQRLSAIKTQEDQLSEAIKNSRGAYEWLEEVEDIWTRRISNLYQWELCLAIRDKEFSWVNEKAEQKVDSHEKSVEEFSGEWWTTDGWGSLIEQTEDPGSELEESWRSFEERSGLNELVDRIESHEWLQSVMNPNALSAFDKKYLGPLRKLRTQYETVADSFQAIENEDVTELSIQIQKTSDMQGSSELESEHVEEMNSRLKELDSVVGGRSPQEVGLIGVVPSDRAEIDLKIQGIIDDSDLSMEEIENGVEIR